MRRFVVALLAVGVLVAYPAGAAVTDWHTHHMLATSRMKGFHTRNVPEGSKIDTRLRVDSVNLPPLPLNHGCRRLYSGRGVVARVSGLCAKGPHPIRLRYAAWHLDHELTFKWRVA